MSYLTRIGGLVFMSVLLLGAGRYVGYRIHAVLGYLPLWSWILIVLSLTLASLIVMMWSVSHITTLATIAYWISGLLITVMLYLLLALLIVDVISIVIPWGQSGRIITAILLALSVTGYGVWHAFDTKIVHQTFTISGLTQPITAVHLTDTHFGHARGLAEAQKIARMINEINPDLVFFTGDMFDSRRALHEDIFATFAQIQAPIYFIEGNHDVHVDVEAIKQAMRDHSVTVLENETAQFGELTIIGLNHMAADAQTRNVHVHDMTHTVQSVLEELAPDPNAPTVLLHHSPDGLQHAAAAGVDLFLAGHTHAGQLFPITLLAKQLFTYNRGHYVVNGMDAYICSGTGTFGPVVRVATRSEICVLELVPEK